MLTGRQIKLVNKITELEAQYDKSVKNHGQLTEDTCQIKCQLAEMYFQLANLHSSQAEYLNAVSYYQKASELTGHLQSYDRLTKENVLSNQSMPLIDESMVLPNDPSQQMSIALQYVCGLGVTRDFKKAFSIFEELCSKGSVVAQCKLGLMFYQGLSGLGNGPAADAESVRYLDLAAGRGFAPAQYRLGWMFHEGRAGVDKGPAADSEAARYYRLAADQGLAPAQGRLGIMLYEGRAGLAKGPAADAEAVRYFRLAAEQGFALSQCNLGQMIHQGRAGVGKGPAADSEAVRYYRLAADQGLAPAQDRLGVMHYEGRAGLAKGPAADAEAVRYFRLAAEQGFALSQCNLGQMIHQGRAGLEKGPAAGALAECYYRLAADQGLAPAQWNLMFFTRPATKVFFGCPIGILNKILNWSPQEIAILLNAEKLSEGMPRKLLVILMAVESQDKLIFFPKDRGAFIGYIDSMIEFINQDTDQALRDQYNACLKQCIEQRVSLFSKNIRAYFPLFFRTEAEFFHDVLSKVSTKITTDSEESTRVKSSCGLGFFELSNASGNEQQCFSLSADSQRAYGAINDCDL
jgi:TPR repeat protein